jgi:hypothetical protein
VRLVDPLPPNHRGYLFNTLMKGNPNLYWRPEAPAKDSLLDVRRPALFFFLLNVMRSSYSRPMTQKTKMPVKVTQAPRTAQVRSRSLSSQPLHGQKPQEWLHSAPQSTLDRPNTSFMDTPRSTRLDTPRLSTPFVWNPQLSQASEGRGSNAADVVCEGTYKTATAEPDQYRRAPSRPAGRGTMKMQKKEGERLKYD